MDLYAATNAFKVLLDHPSAHDILHNWHQNTHRGNPEKKNWKYSHTNCHTKQVKVSNNNLSRIHSAISIIQAVLRGMYARKKVTNILRVEMLSAQEKYRFNECHGGC